MARRPRPPSRACWPSWRLKVEQLGDDLASQDAQAFLRHSEFLNQKFGNKDIA